MGGGERLEIRVKNNKFRATSDQQFPLCKICHKLAHVTISHTDEHDRLFPQITNVFKPSHNMVLVHPLAVAFDFLHTPTLMFLNLRKGGSSQEKGSKSGSRIGISIPRTSQRGPFRPKRGQKGSHSEF